LLDELRGILHRWRRKGREGIGREGNEEEGNEEKDMERKEREKERGG